MDEQPKQPGVGRAWSQTTQRTRMAWSSRPSLGQRIGMVILALVAIGVLAIVGAFALIVGIFVVAILGAIMLVQRGLAKLRGDHRTGDTMRDNVRVIKRDGN